MRLFGAIEKFDKKDDGTLIVSGIASSEVLDSDKETISADAMRSALPEYMKFANIREMHRPVAAGTALSCHVDTEGRTQVTAHIVDSEAVKKIVAGVYKGFSIAGQTLSKIGNCITRLTLSEISLVDRPANPECVFGVWKAEKTVPKPDSNTMDRKLFIKMLALADDATDEQIAEAFTKRITPAAPAKEPGMADVLAKLEKLEKGNSNAEMTATITKLTETVNSLKTESETARQSFEKAERKSLVEAATREGKVVLFSDDEIYGTNNVPQVALSTLKSVLSKAEKSVPLAPRMNKPLDEKVKAETITLAKSRAVESMNEHFSKNSN